MGELSLTDAPERYAKLAFPELERQATRQTTSAMNADVAARYAIHSEGGDQVEALPAGEK